MRKTTVTYNVNNNGNNLLEKGTFTCMFQPYRRTSKQSDKSQ